ncbi:unnamed protein product [Clavelina lepadiformis]|uniref:6-phosphogluconolactonase n=1 Tax=Clavelina lepadiformis TaxID=159417 RepID=A0ABP0GGS3_CLALP
MRRAFCVILVLLVLCACNAHSTISEEIKLQSNHLDITLVGANGDLARKYLWKGLFDLYRTYGQGGEKLSGWTFNLYGAGTKDAIHGTEQLKSTLTAIAFCDPDDNFCAETKNKFLKEIPYVQLKENADYERYCGELSNNRSSSLYCQKGHSCDYQRVFYLSVPPFTYEKISGYIHRHCRSQLTNQLKVVFEKPFGHDEESAKLLANITSSNLQESEIYRIDHYLGKQTIQQIIPFRKANSEIEQILNNHHVERIEVVMKESIGVKGRTKFYDKYGVLSDVMQNHLSEILYLLTMDMPVYDKNLSLSEQLKENKIKLLQQIQTLKNEEVIVGQYKSYQDEVQQDFGIGDKTTNTPTFAGVLLKISSPRWQGVPVAMVAGKMMDERVGYARIVFKETSFVVSDDECSTKQELVFYIGHGNIATPAILVSRNLPHDKSFVPDGWKLETSYDQFSFKSSKLKCYSVYVPNAIRDAYSFLIEQVFLGKQEHFLTTPTLLDSWRIWNSVVNSADDKRLCIYPGGDQNKNSLDFGIQSHGLKFQSCWTQASAESVVQSVWLGQPLIMGSKNEIFATLVDDIIKVAQLTIADGKAFHLALSGGSSPMPLFCHLSQMQNVMPWGKTHIWQVDERCTKDSGLSNFENLSQLLLDHVPSLKYKNIHPMPIETSIDSLCKNDTVMLYEKKLKSLLGDDLRFDYVVLGLGTDGHTASLFPNHPVLSENVRMVAVVENAPVEKTPRRVTLTYRSLNMAKNIAVLATGSSKCPILERLKSSQCSALQSAQFPVCGVVPSGKLTWYRTDSCELLPN